MKIRFTEDRWLNTEDRTKAPKFKKGSTHDLSVESAYRWVRRNVAVYVVDDLAPARPVLKMNRPMMADEAAPLVEARLGANEALSAVVRPKKAKRKLPKGDATVRQIKTGPALPVTGSGKNGGPGWDSV